MAASNTDKFKKLTNNFSTTLSSAIVGSSDSSMSLASTTNLPTDTGAVFVIDRINSSGSPTPGVREYVKGVVSGSNVINLFRGLGGSTAQAHSSGAVVEQVVDQNTINDIIDGVLAQHNQDGTHSAVTAASISATGVVNASTAGNLQEGSVALQTMRADVQFDFVASGCVWTADAAGSTKAASMTSGVVYIGGKRVAVSAVTSRTFTASKDTYIDVDNTGTITYTEVTNNAASPALSANNLRLGIIITGASNIANSGSVNQGQETMVLPIASSIPYAVTDSLGNLICPRDPNRRILGYKQITSSFSVTAGTAAQVTGLSCPVIVPTGRKVKITISAPNFATTSIAYRQISIWDGVVGAGTQLSNCALVEPTANGYAENLASEALTTPTTTSKTYNFGACRDAGTSSIAAATALPAWIKVELV